MATKISQTNIVRLQVYDLKMCGYVCIRFTDFIFKGKTQTAFTNLFLLHNLEKNYELILNYVFK